MKKTINFWILLLTLLLVFTIWAIFRYTPLTFPSLKAFSILIAMLAMYGALLNAVFLGFSTYIANTVYIESKKPQLLIRVMKLNEEPFPTWIFYKNITKNKFHELTIVFTVDISETSYELKDLFKNKMTMIGLDDRSKSFDFLEELKKIGVHIDMELMKQCDQNITLNIKYEFNWNNKKIVENVQDYKWNYHREGWELS